MTTRISWTTVWLLVAVFAVAVLVAIATVQNAGGSTTLREATGAVNDVATTTTDTSAGTRTLSPVELALLHDLGYSVGTDSTGG